jgi:hypothetical protein
VSGGEIPYHSQGKQRAFIMGEAKRRAVAQAAAHANVDTKLRQLGVDTDQFGFFDQPAFVTQEQHDSTFLIQYALWVNSRPRTQQYDERVRKIVPFLAEYLADLFEREGMQRSCVHVSSMMTRILDRLGVWSFSLHGSMIAEVASKALWRGQSMCDIQDFPGAEVGHAWVVAPPYVVVDATIRLQNPLGDPMNAFTPHIVTVEDAPLIKPTIDDVVSGKLQEEFRRTEGRFDSQLHHRLVPGLRSFSREFPSREIRIGDMALRYVPSAIRISDVGLEEINKAGRKLTGTEVWNDHIVPQFSNYIV